MGQAYAKVRRQQMLFANLRDELYHKPLFVDEITQALKWKELVQRSPSGK